jgi:hypothetical protein
MDMDEVKVETVSSMPVSTEQEWFIALVDWQGSGDFWGISPMYRTRREAEFYVRNADCVGEAKQARIVRVVLPCKALP